MALILEIHSLMLSVKVWLYIIFHVSKNSKVMQERIQFFITSDARVALERVFTISVKLMYSF